MVKKKALKKHTWNPYTSDIQRFSVYPKVKVYEDNELRIGDTIEVYVNNVDDRGKGLAFYRGFRVYINNVNVGSKVKAIVKEIKGSEVYCDKVDVVEENNVEY